MKVKETKAKSIIVKSNLPEGGFVINPYIGCMHGCIYCYARFMKRFTNHQEPWGKFLDIKINAPDLIPADTKKYKNKFIIIGSVTDAYQPMERKYKLMRGILTNLIPLQPNLCVMTKSDLIVRDIDLLKKFKKCMAGVSLSLLNDKARKEVEPLASSVERRINAVKKLKKSGINTFIFVSPIFPKLTDWRKLINKTKNFVNEYWFENLNLYPSIKNNIYGFLKGDYPELVGKYQEIYSAGSNYWQKEEKEIKNFCSDKKIKCRIYFHHSKT